MMLSRMLPALAAALCSGLVVTGCRAQPPADALLVLERQIALPNVAGRIDHLDLDATAGRLFIAELGNGTVEALDIASGRSLGRIGHLEEPQGLAYLPRRDELAVATGGDGMLRFYRAADLALVGSIKLGDDADNVRFDPESGHLVVGYGKALAVVDPAVRSLLRTIALPAHPEGFQVHDGRAIVNLPGAGAVAEVDLASGRELARWRNPGPSFNFPLALDADHGLVAVVYRLPARLALFDIASGRVLQQLPTCGDADDAFFDPPRHRLYVVCGSGAVDVFEHRADSIVPAGRRPTRSGARTGLFSAKLDRLFVAARAEGDEPAAIIVVRPKP